MSNRSDTVSLNQKPIRSDIGYQIFGTVVCVMRARCVDYVVWRVVRKRRRFYVLCVRNTLCVPIVDLNVFTTKKKTSQLYSVKEQQRDSNPFGFTHYVLSIPPLLSNHSSVENMFDWLNSSHNVD